MTPFKWSDSALACRSSLFFCRLLLVAAFLSLPLWFASRVQAEPGEGPLWQEVEMPREVSRRSAAQNVQGNKIAVPPSGRAFVFDKEAMEKLLARAPAETAERSRKTDVELLLPLPSGQYERFSVRKSPIMSEQLAAQFPSIKSYVVQGLDDPTATGRLDTSPQGFRAMILSASGTFFIDPHWRDGDQISICYARKDLEPGEKAKRWSCGLPDSVGPPRPAPQARGAARPTGSSLRTYRAAIAATGEYTAFHGGTVVGALAAINTTMNRVNAVYEREFCIRMVLVGNNASIIYANAASDPYTNGDPDLMIDENQTNVDAVIGNANYDIGHVFGTDSGGLAGLGVVCVPDEKAQGVTGSDAPVGDAFDVDYVCHEMGHQFSANHTFNAANNGNRSSATAYEPGSGSTIMSYAGIISGQNLQRFANDYFHSGSYSEIFDFITTGAAAAAFSTTPTGNTAPTIGPLANYTIPARTPFVLTASATGGSGGALTYCWEQFDLGPAQNPVTASPRDNGSSPIFRSYPPSTNPVRFFPSLPYVLNNTNTPPTTYASNGVTTWATGEALPTTSRTMNFRVSVRDNRAGGGAQNWASSQVTTVSTAGPFRISSQNTAQNIATDAPFTVTWDVAGTASTPISCQTVNVSFSTNGGADFPIVLASNVPNNGAATVSIPAANSTTNGRIKIEAVGNIFFDINDARLAAGAGLPPTPDPAFRVDDRGPPTIRLEWPRRSYVSTEKKRVTLRGVSTDNIKLSRLQYRLMNPYQSKFGPWRKFPLRGDLRRQSWTLPITLDKAGTWLVQVRSRDAVGYASPSRFLYITRE